VRVRVVPYAELRRLVPNRAESLWLDLPEGATVGDVLRTLNVTIVERLIVGVDGTYATLDTPLPVRNWQEGVMDTVELIDAKALKAEFGEKMDGCYACSVRCKKRVRVDATLAGVEVEPKYGGAEYETLGAVGTNLGIDNLVELCKANQALNWWGLDSVSTGVTIAWAMECYQRGILTTDDTGGLALEWGDGKLLNRLIDMIATREGFGDFPAEGALRAARTLGRDSERYVVHVRGLEIAMHDPRAMEHMKTNYPVNPTGGDHTGGAPPRTSIRNTIGVCQFLQYDDARHPERRDRLEDGAGGARRGLRARGDDGAAVQPSLRLRQGRRQAAAALPRAAQARPVRKPAADHRGGLTRRRGILRCPGLGSRQRHPDGRDAGAPGPEGDCLGK